MMMTERNHLVYARHRADRLVNEGDCIGSQSIHAICDEVERLRAIVDKLPKTADGVAVTGNETLYVAYGSGLIHPFVATGPYITSAYGIEGAYSTRVAAEATKEK